MASEYLPPLTPTWFRRSLGWSVLFVILVVEIFTFPNMPEAGLDPSWRMALGYMFEHGMQFGRDVVFTYGPLGFIMSNTYSGIQFWNLITGQLALAIISAVAIVLLGRRLTGASRVIYFGFFLLFGTAYADALHMLVIAIMGFELLRHQGNRWNWITGLIAASLALYAQIKFTDFMLSTVVVLVAGGYSLWRKNGRETILLVGGFVGSYLAIWLLCGQSLANLPAYFRGSWAISEGYQWAMGFPTPMSPLWKGLVVLLLMMVYAGFHVKLNPDKPRAVANVMLFGAFLYLNWKHGFVRADGHMIGFFYCALLPLTAYPAMLEDTHRFRLLHRWVFLGLIFLSLWGIETALPGIVRGAAGRLQERIWYNVEAVTNWQVTRQRYREALTIQRKAADLYQTREQSKNSTIDIMGVEQNVAILNRLNYRPRPVIQSYSTFMPQLARLNYDFYLSDEAPEFILLKIQTIDGRLPAMDDSMALRLLLYRYEFQRSEKGFLVWKRKPGPFDAAAFEPKLVHSATLPVAQPLVLTPWASQPLWLKVDLKPSLLGVLRSFLYKPPQVMIGLQSVNGPPHSFLMPLPMGRTGFIVNPLVDDPASYMELADSRSQRTVRSVAIEIEPQDRKYFADTVSYELSTLPPPASGGKYFASLYSAMFHMFYSFPTAYEAKNPFSEVMIDGRDFAVMHAPSVMTFDMVKGASSIRGKFAFMPGAYTNGGRTNGAEFVVYWSNGTTRTELFKQYLDPLNSQSDGGIHSFAADLTGVTGGRLYLQVKPGPYDDISWDWTCWSDIEIK